MKTATVLHEGHTFTANVVDTSVTILRDGVLAGTGTLTLTRAGGRIDDCPANIPEAVFPDVGGASTCRTQRP